MITCFNYGVELILTKAQAAIGSHPGDCQAGIDYLLTVPAIRRQLDRLEPAAIARELAEYGAWDSEELQDTEANRARLLWIACGDIQERLAETGAL
jgi:hypothetical protein